jgi:2-oxoglutarate dehydrogenase E1 component
VQAAPKPALENTMFISSSALLSRGPAPAPAQAPEPAPAAAPKPALENTMFISSSALISRAPAPAVPALTVQAEPAPRAAPANRDALLERLRTRAKTLDPTAVQRILSDKSG